MNKVRVCTASLPLPGCIRRVSSIADDKRNRLMRPKWSLSMEHVHVLYGTGCFSTKIIFRELLCQSQCDMLSSPSSSSCEDDVLLLSQQIATLSRGKEHDNIYMTERNQSDKFAHLEQKQPWSKWKQPERVRIRVRARGFCGLMWLQKYKMNNNFIQNAIACSVSEHWKTPSVKWLCLQSRANLFVYVSTLSASFHGTYVLFVFAQNRSRETV